MAKIAVDLERAVARRIEHGTKGETTRRIVARGEGWIVADVICTCGPRDRSFEEQHADYSIAVVAAGTFQYRSPLGHGMMTAGSLLLGNPGLCFECGHEHGDGDRCIAFWFAPDYFERVAAAIASSPRGDLAFRTARVAPLGSLSPVVTLAAAGVTTSPDVAWEEVGVRLIAHAVSAGAAARVSRDTLPPNAVARVTRTVRAIGRHPDARLTLGALARDAGLSPYHFLRTFEQITGVTPHQFVVRTRLREAAMRLASESRTVTDIALDSGFGDISNFTRAFRAEFGVTPRAYRQQLR